MKTWIILPLVVLLLGLQTLQAASVADGGERHRRTKETQPTTSKHLGEGGPSAGLEIAELASRSADSSFGQAAPGIAEIEVAAQDSPVVDPPKPSRSARNLGYDPDRLSPIFGILSLGFGVMAIFAGISMALAPLFGVIFLLAVPLAVIFGIVGMSRKRQNRGLAIAGFILGMLCIAIMLLFVLAVLVFFF